MAKTKSATSYEEQLEILKRRGVIVKDDNTCKQILESINYYRLMAYFLPFKLPDDTYKEGTDFLRRLWGAVMAVRGLFLDSKKWNIEILPALEALVEEYSDTVELYHMAFPKEWKTLLEK